MKREIQHEVAGAIANLHIPQGDWGEDDQMDFSDPPPTSKRDEDRGSGNSFDGGDPHAREEARTRECQNET